MREGFDYMLRAFGVRARSVLHVGAHEGQERDVYRDYGAERAVFVEPLPAVFERLQANIAPFPGFEAAQAVCSDKDGERITFNVASNEESSSILDLGKHKEFFPDIDFRGSFEATTRTVDSLVAELFPQHGFNVLVLDTQGAELKILQGAAKLLETLDVIYTEVNEEPLYEGSCTLVDLIEYLKPLGFGLKWLTVNNTMFGDGLFVKNDRSQAVVPPVVTAGTNIALNKPTRQSSAFPFWPERSLGRAVDGIRSGGFGFHTDLETDPWWEIDLDREHPISEMIVFNRMDVAAFRARSLRIMGEHDGVWTLVHDQQGRPFGGTDGYPLRVKLDGRPYRRFRLELKGRDYLHLDQIEIYSAE